MSFQMERQNRIKYFLCVVCFVFMLTGAMLIAVSSNVKDIYSEYELFLQTKFLSIPTYLIVIGSFVIVLSFFGCWGALRENHFIISIFLVLLSLTFLWEVIAGISGYVLEANTENLISENLYKSLNFYNSTHPDEITILWDNLHRGFACCGVDNYTNWQPFFQNDLPMSCCTLPNGIVATFNCTSNMDNMNRYWPGCLTYFSLYISSHAANLGAAAFAIAIIQLHGILFSCYIARKMENRDYKNQPGTYAKVRVFK